MALACRLAPIAAAAAASRRLPVPMLCRAASAKASRAAAAKQAPPSSYSFEGAAHEPVVFPELLEPGRRAVLLAVDPDLHGAVVALSWRNPPDSSGDGSSDGSGNSQEASSSSSSSSSGSGGSSGGNDGGGGGGHRLPLAAVGGLQVELHDMPVEVWQYGTRAKRQPAAEGLIAILQRYTLGEAAVAALAAAAAAAPGGVSVAAMGGKEPRPKRSSSSSDGKKKRGKRKGANGAEEEADSAAAEAAAEAAAAEAAAAEALAAQQAAAAAAEEGPPIIRAVMEYNMPGQLSGKYAWYGIGFASGLLNGLLVGAGIPYQRVHATTWKGGMGLRKQGKEGSIALACHLLPAAAPLLQRKKDHGRAEALVLAAYALGVRMQPLGGSAAEAAAAAAAAEDDDEEEQLSEEEEE